MRPLGILLCALLLSACGSWTKFYPTNASPRPLHPRSSETVELFTTTAPTKPFVEVGILRGGHSGGMFSTADEAEILLAIRQKGGEVGCDGVILTAENASVYASASGSNGYATASSTTKKDFRAACIMFRE